MVQRPFVLSPLWSSSTFLEGLGQGIQPNYPEVWMVPSRSSNAEAADRTITGRIYLGIRAGLTLTTLTDQLERSAFDQR